MAVSQQAEWTDGFPFSRSIIRAGRCLPEASVTAPMIPDAMQAAAVYDRSLSFGAGAESAPVAWTKHPQDHPVGRRDGVRVLPIGAFVWGGSTRGPMPRTRPDHVLLWLVRGEVRLDFPRDRIGMQAGDLRYVPAGTAFAAVPDAAAQGHVVLIGTRLADKALPALPDRGLSTRVGCHAARLGATLTELSVKGAPTDARALCCLVSLLSLRLDHLSQGNECARSAPALPDRPLVDRFLDLARQGLGRSTTVADMAAELDSTLAQLDQACLAAHRKRAIDLIHDMQLECAVRLLRESMQPVHRIAADLGYSSHAHFVRAFVAATGRRPEVFRAQSC